MKRNVETPTSRPHAWAGEPQGDLWTERDRMLEEANAGCNESDTGVVPGPKGSRRPAGAPPRESRKNRLGEGRRRTTARAAGAPSTPQWSAVDWRQVHKEVWRLQVLIAEAVRQFRRNCWVGQPAFGVLEMLCAAGLGSGVARNGFPRCSSREVGGLKSCLLAAPSLG
jgi:hypothetical protein